MLAEQQTLSWYSHFLPLHHHRHHYYHCHLYPLQCQFDSHTLAAGLHSCQVSHHPPEITNKLVDHEKNEIPLWLTTSLPVFGPDHL